ncbi:MAG: sugar transferase [Anaerolineales bacterium]|uniref:sugar transferase n=1 Tax=Candidatus Villigracilis proximus TaxID=3140683 RepID=UPI0031350253|nr:sugar transferase [Anaerolineales bacterium]
MIRFRPLLKQSKNIELVNISFRIMLSGLMKRVFDIAVALIGLILLSPFFVFIAILIKQDSPGPVFYWGPRFGLRGVIFKMLKFRTMYETQKVIKVCV